MTRIDYLRQVTSQIEGYQDGTVFTASDFAEIADPKTIFMSLSRLSEKGKVTKVMRGVYMKPKYSSLTHKNVPPIAENIAQAIARNYGWTITPSGSTALNLLGLSAQIPASWVYISSGPYKKYELDSAVIIFKHTDKSTELTNVSGKTAILIQAIKAMGKERMNPAAIDTLSSNLTADEKKTALKEAQYCTAWIYEYIKQICKGTPHA